MLLFMLIILPLWRVTLLKTMLKGLPQMNWKDLMEAYGIYLTMVCIILKNKRSELCLIAEHHTKEDHSNEHLLQGPDLTSSLVSVLV